MENEKEMNVNEECPIRDSLWARCLSEEYEECMAKGKEHIEFRNVDKRVMEKAGMDIPDLIEFLDNNRREKTMQVFLSHIDSVKKVMTDEVESCKHDRMSEEDIEVFVQGFCRAVQQLNILSREDSGELNRYAEEIT